MKTNFLNTFVFRVGLFLCFFISCMAYAQAQNSNYNFSTFSAIEQKNLDHWKTENAARFYNHPELGILSEKAPCFNCVEDLSKRNENQRSFRDIDDPSKIYVQTAYGTFNEMVDGYWISLRDKLMPVSPGMYANRYEVATVSFNTTDKLTSIENKQNSIRFNNWLLEITYADKSSMRQKADWSRISIGEDGAYITNIFYGIDAELIVSRGAIKTNFIIKENKYGVFEELVFIDRYNSDQPVSFSFLEKPSGLNGNVSKVFGEVAGNAVVQVDEARAFVAHQENETFTFLPYRIHQNTIGLVVPYNWIEKNISKGFLIIDPLVTSTAMLNQLAITGSKYSSVCFGDYCSYTLPVPAILNTVISNLKYSFNYYATAPCTVEKGAYSIHLGSCRAPNMPNFFKCNLQSSGVCIADSISIFSNLSNCMSNFYCSATNLNLELRLYRCQDASSGCGTQCIKAASDWVVTMEGIETVKETPTLSRTVICQNDTVKGSVIFTNALQPVTHQWSLNADGTGSLGTGINPTMTLITSGNYPIYVKSTDGCGTVYLDSVNITVHPTFLKTEYDTICALQLPLIWRGQTVYNGGNNAATVNLSPVKGCDSIFKLNLVVKPTINKTESRTICNAMLPYSWNGKVVNYGGNGVARDTSISSISGCDSITILNLNVTSRVTAVQTIHICHTQLPYLWNGKLINSGGYNIATDTAVSLGSGCDSVTYLHLSVHMPANIQLTQHICDGGSYNYFGTIYNSTGTYVHQYTSLYGCDSTVTLNIIKNPIDTIQMNEVICPNSTYNFYGTSLANEGTYYHLDIVGTCNVMRKLNLSFYDTIRTSNYYSICTGDSVVWGGTTLATSGIYSFYGVNAAGCDTMHKINLVVSPMDTYIVYQSICPLDTYNFYGNQINFPGVYYYTDSTNTCIVAWQLQLSSKDTIRSHQYVYLCSGTNFNFKGNVLNQTGDYSFGGVNATGCDTIHTVHVYIDPPLSLSFYETICKNTSYQFFNILLTQAGTYTHQSSVGCDTTWTLYLTVIDTVKTSYTVTICEGSAYSWAGVSYTNPGVYQLAGTNAGGCDTLHTLNLFRIPMDTVDITDSLCFSGNFFFYNQQITGSGVYIHKDTTLNCDTTWRLTVSLFDTIKTSYTDTFCIGQVYTWKGVNYTTSGIYNLFGVNAKGCDTLRTLNLYFTPPDTIIQNATICSGKSFPLGPQQYNSSGTYYWYNTSGVCDKVYQLNLTVEDTIRTVIYDTICSGLFILYDGSYFTNSGAYHFYGQNAQGCDTLRTLNLTVTPPIMDSTFATICPGDTFNFYGIKYTDNGVYTRSSITEGCDTAYILTLYVPDVPHLKDTFNICAQDSVVYNGVVMRTTGVYPFHYTSIDNCDSVYSIILNVVPYLTDSLFASTCGNVPYIFYDSTILMPGVYTHMTYGALCDTLHILTLQHFPFYHQTQQLTYCNNDLPATYLGVSIPYGTLSLNAFDSVLLTTVDGCDSMIVLDLIIKDTSRKDIDTTLCFGVIYEFGNHFIAAPGTYFDVQTNNVGCDSLIAIHVLYTPPAILQDTFLKRCEVVSYRDSLFYENVQFIDTFRNMIQCDSVYRTVTIEVPYVVYDSLLVEICEGEGYDFHGRKLNSSIQLTDVFTNDNGCDSFVTLDLIVRPLPVVNLEIQALDDLICVLDSVNLHGEGALNYTFYNEYFYPIGKSEESIRTALFLLNRNKFIVVGQNEYGCVDTAEAVVNTELCCDLQIPTAFSPNNDGLNDVFGPVTAGTPKNYRMEIYNRLGNRIFVSFHINNQWKGENQKGKQANIGVYFYRITGNCFDGTPFEFVGEVTLLR